MNEIIRNLTIENFLNLKSSYDNSKKIFWDEGKRKLVHPGEYGNYRERLVKRWLRIYTPERFGISSGFLINSDNKISTQCDIIIYDRDKTPQIQATDDQVFFPIETVAIVGEIKSDINSATELNTYLEKLSELKKLREGVKFPTPYFTVTPERYNPTQNSLDNIFTFLICNKINFDLTKNPINYKSELKHKHNLILSLNDGLISYVVKAGSPQIAIPFGLNNPHHHCYVEDDGQELPSFIGLFLCSLHNALISTTLLEIDMAFYLSDNVYEKEY